jgi:sulfite exporter TauE/SafE/copper chaperone CopZ
MALINERLPIIGMRCVGCETILEDTLKTIPGVLSAKANHARAWVDVRFDDDLVRLSQILVAIEGKGYAVTFGGAASVAQSPIGPWLSKALVTLLLFVVIGGVVFWGKSLMPGVMMQMQIPQVGYSMILLVGFLTGFHCIGMCGSFVVSYATASAGKSRAGRALAHFEYALGKTISYSTLGAAFGLLGALVTITPIMRGAVAVAAGVFLVMYGLRMLDLVNGASWLNWVFPKSLMQGVQGGMRRQPKPLLTGLLTGFLLGCGPLQAMYIMAAGTGSPREGALLLMFFCLGTLGPLLTFGFFAHLLSHRMMNELLRVSGVLVLLMGLMMTNKGLKLTGSGYDMDSLRQQWQVIMQAIAQHPGGHGDH